MVCSVWQGCTGSAMTRAWCPVCWLEMPLLLHSLRLIPLRLDTVVLPCKARCEWSGTLYTEREHRLTYITYNSVAIYEIVSARLFSRPHAIHHISNRLRAVSWAQLFLCSLVNDSVDAIVSWLDVSFWASVQLSKPVPIAFPISSSAESSQVLEMVSTQVQSVSSDLCLFPFIC